MNNHITPRLGSAVYYEDYSDCEQDAPPRVQSPVLPKREKNALATSLKKTAGTAASTASWTWAFGKKVMPAVSTAAQIATGLYIGSHYAMPWTEEVCYDSPSTPQDNPYQPDNDSLGRTTQMMLYSSCIAGVFLACKCSKNLLNRTARTISSVSGQALDAGKKIYQYYYPDTTVDGPTFTSLLPPKPRQNKSDFELFEQEIYFMSRHELEQTTKHLYALNCTTPLGRALPPEEIDPERIFWQMACKSSSQARFRNGTKNHHK